MRGIDNSSLIEVAQLLARYGGHYVFSVGGREYVVVAREEARAAGEGERQGVLPIEQPDTEAGSARQADAAVLAQINRDIALYRQHRDDDLAGGDLVFEDTGGDIARVRFEPLRGDLPPELQE